MTDVLSRRDLDFLLYEWLDVESLTSAKRFAEHSKDTFDAVLDLCADIAHSRTTSSPTPSNPGCGQTAPWR